MGGRETETERGPGGETGTEIETERGTETGGLLFQFCGMKSWITVYNDMQYLEHFNKP